MKAKTLFLVYVVVLLFLGESVRQFLHIDLGDEGVVATSHYAALPFIFVAVAANWAKIRFTTLDKWIFLLVVFIVFVKTLLGKSAGFSIFLNSAIEPVLLLTMLRLADVKTIAKTKKIFLIFFVVECFVAIFEAVTRRILFASDIETVGLFGDMRAYSLHGHPLQNAFLVSTISTVILCSRMKITYRYALFFLGYFAVFSFNTRSSIYFLAVVLLVNVWRDMRSRRIRGWKKGFFLAGLCVAIFWGLDYIETHSLGSRMATGLTSDDSSSEARFVLVGEILSLNVKDLLFGVNSSYVQAVMDRNWLIAIENSFVSLIFGNGLIFTIAFSFLMYKELKRIGNGSFMFYTTIVLTFLLLNANNALMTTCPVIPVLVIALYVFREDGQVCISRAMSKCNMHSSVNSCK